MSNAIEIEAKALVRPEDYKKLLKRFGGYRKYKQTNYYLDNDKSEMRKEGLGLRIRERNGEYEMTLKTPLSQGLLEKNEHIKVDQFEDFAGKGIFPENDLKRFLTMMDIDVSSLRIKGALTTERIDVPYKGGKLSIDKNEYSDIVDYEVELEYNNEKDAEDLLRELFEEENIPFSLNKKTKVARALSAH